METTRFQCNHNLDQVSIRGVSLGELGGKTPTLSLVSPKRGIGYRKKKEKKGERIYEGPSVKKEKKMDT